MSHVFHGSTSLLAGAVDRLRETIIVEYREMVHRLLPVLGRSAPVGGDVSQRQPDQLGGRIVAGEVSPRLDDLAKPRIDALDRVGRVDHPADLRREREERNHVAPGPAPGGHHGGEFLAPGPLLEGIELGLGGLGTGGRVDRPDGRRQQLSVLPAGVVQGVADQVHDAGLQRGGREHRRQGLWHALEAVSHGNQNIGYSGRT